MRFIFQKYWRLSGSMPLSLTLQKGLTDPQTCHAQRPLQVTGDKHFLKMFTTLPKPTSVQLGSHRSSSP